MTERPGATIATAGREGQVTEAFVALADTLVDGYDVIDLLDQLVRRSVALLAADEAAILLSDEQGGLGVAASSSDDAKVMELLALQSEEGPCFDCFRNGVAVDAPHLHRDADRWPRFVAAVVEHGAFGSAHALPLRLRDRTIGVLTLLHRAPGTLPVADLALAQALADVATIGILAERTVRSSTLVADQLQAALDNRVVVEQAKGVLAQRYGWPMSEAFEAMRSHARNHNLRLKDVAHEVVSRRLDLSAERPGGR